MLTVKQAAEILTVSEWVVNQLLVLGDLGGYKIKGVWRTTEEQIDEYLELAKNTRNSE